MSPLYFGTRQQLFGVFHPPGGAETGRGGGVVLCCPYGQDYVYAHRPLRTLATRLARGGAAVLRFDYLGTGDSAGDVEDASVSQWTADVIDAIDHVRSEGCTTLSLVGFRLGATLAATAAVRCGGVACLVLWDPVIDGPGYVSALKARHRRWFEELARGLPRSRQLEAEEDLLGFRFTAKFRADLERLNLGALDSRPARDVLIVSTEERKDHAGLGQQLRELGSNVDVKRIEDQKIWSMVPGMPLGLVPSRVLTEIDSWLRASAHA